MQVDATDISLKEQLEKWNATETSYPDVRLHELIERRVEQQPTNVAVMYGNTALTYAELNARANRLARHLRALGLGGERTAAVVIERCPEMMVGLLAILKAGAAYVPLDLSHPIERLVFTLDDSQPAVLLTHPNVAPGIRCSVEQQAVRNGASIVNLADECRWARMSSANLEGGPEAASSLAYLIYTSGSTGRPKGVMIEHRGLVNRLVWMQRTFALDSTDRILQKTPLGFDVSVWELFWPLIAGARLVVLPPDEHKDPERLWAAIRQHQITTLHFVPAMLQSFLARPHSGDLPSLTRVICSGEALPRTLALRLRQRLPRAKLFNLYGPTEATIDVTWWRCEESDPMRDTVPIGRPISNVQMHVLDGRERQLGIDDIGELYIGGVGVGRGYWRQPELTAERFVPDPFTGHAGARMYKTGDLGRYLTNGSIEFLGRNDFQVKLRGFRIELGEIEAHLQEYPGIQAAVVLATDAGQGDKRLVAYFTATDDGDSGRFAPQPLRKFLSAALAEYMIPSAFVRLSALPVTANGKVDRRALPDAGEDAYASDPYQPPVGEVEERVAAIWSEALSCRRVGRHDNFFQIGGHSLSAVQVLDRLRREGIYVKTSTFFGGPTVAGIAAAAANRPDTTSPPPTQIPPNCSRITPDMLPLVSLTQAQIDAVVGTVAGGIANVQDVYPLAPLQEGIFFHNIMASRGDPYLMYAVVELEDRDRLDAYLRAAQAVIDRNDILRTAVVSKGLPEPVQVVWRRARLQVEEVSLAPGEGSGTDQLVASFSPRRFRMDLSVAPLVKVVVARDLATGRWLAMGLLHHLAVDHSTLDLAAQEVRAHLAGREMELEAPVAFRSFVVAQRSPDALVRDEQFFKTMLSDVEVSTAPFGLEDVQGDGDDVVEARRELDPVLARRIRRCASTLGVSSASLHHLAWAQVLARASGQDDIVFGTLLFGRMQGGQGIERSMGLFINTLPLRFRVDSKGVKDCAREMHSLLVDLLQHEHASLAKVQRLSRVAAPAPLFAAVLNYVHEAAEAGPFAGAAGEWEGMKVLRTEERTNYPLLATVTDDGGGFTLAVQATYPVPPGEVCAMMCAALEHLVTALETSPGSPLCNLDVLPEDVRGRLLVEWNVVENRLGPDECIHRLFEAQVRRTPGVPALTFEGRTTTYAALNGRANRLARYLWGLGVGPEARVAICLERSEEMIVALLATLKVGAQYVPLDPDYPPSRLRHVLRDCSPTVILTDGRVSESVGAELQEAVRVSGRVTLVDLLQDAERWRNEPECDLTTGDVAVATENAAYVIYTSGSTGNPKGVVVTHANVTRLMRRTQHWFEFAPTDVWTLFHSYAFDFSVWEIWGALLHGGRLVIVPASVARSPEEFYGLICREGVTVLNQTPSAFRQLTAAAMARTRDVHRLRFVIFGGEALDVGILEPWFRESEGRDLQFVNMYGITETTVHVTFHRVDESQTAGSAGSLIGRRIPDLRVYVLDERGRPAPSGVVGELFVGGLGVARGYLNRPDLTAERFIPDPFTKEAGARMYRTGDLGRWLRDGTLEYRGRNDGQIKIRGFRTELGEIEALVASHPGVREVVVLTVGTGVGQKLVAYYTAGPSVAFGTDSGGVNPTAERLRAHCAAALPEYMVPAAYVRIASFPLTVNGKLDRRQLPEPGPDSYATVGYEAPVGEVETTLARLWTEVLKVERVSRLDNFFELGGHSLLAVSLLEQMRKAGLNIGMRAVFSAGTLAALAAAVDAAPQMVQVPENRIPVGTQRITPDMLPLVDLAQDEIQLIVSSVPGGAANVQDIYPLAPLQEGVFFHHLASRDGDPYVVSTLRSFDTRARLDGYLAAFRRVIDRHDILRTSVHWEGLREPVQVVWRQATLIVEEVSLDQQDTDAEEELFRRFDRRHYRLDVRRAPMLRLFVACDRERGRWLALELVHHLWCDNTAEKALHREIQMLLRAPTCSLPPSVPFRRFVAQARLGFKRKDHERFFQELLGDVVEPTVAFGLADVHGDGREIGEASRHLDGDFARRLRRQARLLGVSAPTLHHLAWAMVVAAASGRDDVVFGTVLFGRMEGADGATRALGMHINSLPVRVRRAELTARDAVRSMHTQLTQLLHHEQAPLALAQRCSAVPPPTPLFNSLLNCRQIAEENEDESSANDLGMRIVCAEERTNYPLGMSVDDVGNTFNLIAQVQAPIDPSRVCDLMCTALERLVTALERAPALALGSLDILPASERQKVVTEWNLPLSAGGARNSVCEMFEEQAARAPDTIAVTLGEQGVSYGEVSRRVARLAAFLREQGVGPETVVGVSAEPSVEMVVALLGVLKAGGAYLPVDPTSPAERLRLMLEQSGVDIVLVSGARAAAGLTGARRVIDVGAERPTIGARPPFREEAPWNPGQLAYSIYSSGSTGTPKAALLEHGGLSNLVTAQIEAFGIGPASRVLQLASLGFDASVSEVFTAICSGARLCLVRRDDVLDPQALARVCRTQRINVATISPSLLATLDPAAFPDLETLILAGEYCPSTLVRRWMPGRRVFNAYGPTEATVCASIAECNGDVLPPVIGRPMAGVTLYVVDRALNPAPIGVPGELMIGGAGLARAYLNRPDLTAESFVPNPFAITDGRGDLRLYRTGDRARFRYDGSIEFLGRQDHQIKLRGFRIEPGEIEFRLTEHPGVAEAVVVARESETDEKSLVAYFAVKRDGGTAGVVPSAESLRGHLARYLPEYMIPIAFVPVESWPRTANGKLDRRALPAPGEATLAVPAYVEPVGEVETRLARVWSEVLKRDRVGRHDSFFQLGGHSLLAVVLLERMRREDLHADVRALFAAPTVASLAAAIGDVTEVTL